MSKKLSAAFMKNLILLLTTLSLSFSVFADSPVTSTKFHTAYQNEQIVQQAIQSHNKLSDNLMSYIAKPSNPLEIKLAVINAIGWNINGTKNSNAFLKFVIQNKKDIKQSDLNLTTFKSIATADELVCYAYLKSMDNYFNVQEATEYASLAVKKNPASFATNMILRLLWAQKSCISFAFCKAFNIFNELKKMPNLKMDMRKEAQPLVFEYMNGIGDNCKQHPER